MNEDEQRRQHHLRRERERHSRPMPLHSQPSPAEAKRPASVQPDATTRPAALAA